MRNILEIGSNSILSKELMGDLDIKIELFDCLLKLIRK